MRYKTLLTSLTAALVVGLGAGVTQAQSIAPVRGDDADQAQIDRYLDVEVWTGRSDGEYYEGDNIVIYFRVNRDAFIAIYSIDTRGRVVLLYPTFPGEDNYVSGGVTYSLPGGDDDYDLVVNGPEGFEHIQIIASRERFPIPDWYHGPELVADTDDRDSYMDWVNTTYFTNYGGQRFAYDRAVVYVNEWEENYFRPVYDPVYPSWTLYGNCYIDYPWGASVYVNGIYWGCVPLYVPRLAVGWHTITIYDHWGYCWEHDFHVSRYNTVVFNKTIINTSPTVKSKYKEVRELGYRDPVRNGYPDFENRRKAISAGLSKSGSVVGHTGAAGDDDFPDFGSVTKKYVRGSTKLVKTERGFETDASSAIFPDKTGSKLGSTSRARESGVLDSRSKSSGGTPSSGAGETGKRLSPDKSGRLRSSDGSGSGAGSTVGSSKRRTNGSATPDRKSGSTSSKAPVIEKRKSSGKSESGTVKQETSKQKSTPPADTKKEVKPAAPSSGKSSSSDNNKGGSSKGKSGGGGNSKSGKN
jgi:hypothetical protein